MIDLAVPLVLSRYGKLLTILLQTSVVIASFDLLNNDPVDEYAPEPDSTPNLYFQSASAWLPFSNFQPKDLATSNNVSLLCPNLGCSSGL